MAISYIIKSLPYLSYPNVSNFYYEIRIYVLRYSLFTSLNFNVVYQIHRKMKRILDLNMSRKTFFNSWKTLRDFDINHWKATLDTKTLSFPPSSFVTNSFPFDVLQFWKHYFKWNSWQTVYFCIELIFILILTYHDPLRKEFQEKEE